MNGPYPEGVIRRPDIILPRRGDWAVRLSSYLAEVADRRFQTGVWDCGLFVGGAIGAMTGTDISAPFKGRYKTPKGAQKQVMKAGFKDHVDVVAHYLTEIEPARAAMGDIAALPDNSPEALFLPSLGVFQGGGRIFVLSDEGVISISRNNPVLPVQRAFRVG